MKHGIKILYGILVLTILISFFHILNDKGGSGFRNIIDTLTISSLLLFVISIILILSSFKTNIRKLSIWVILILSCPLAISFSKHLTKEIYLKMIETTTPNEFLYNVKVKPIIYEQDKIRLQNLVDSLIEVGIIQRPAKLTLRYFNGKTYNDTIQRDWAIDLPRNLYYKKSIIDTLFYSKNGNHIIAGLLINKVFNKLQDYPDGGIEYIGKGFIFDKSAFKPIKMLKYTISRDEYKSCSERLRYYYFKKNITYNELNINDIRFLKKHSN